jgi:hypothetical protein
MANQKPFRNCYLSKTNSPLNISPNSESPLMLHTPVLARVTLNRPDAHQEIVANYIKYSANYWSNVRIRQRAYLEQQRQEKLELEAARRLRMPPYPNTKSALNEVDVVYAHVSPKSVWRQMWSCI